MSIDTDDTLPRPALTESRWGSCSYRTPRQAAGAMWTEWAIDCSPEELRETLERGAQACLAELMEGWGLHPCDREVALESFEAAIRARLAFLAFLAGDDE